MTDLKHRTPDQCGATLVFLIRWALTAWLVTNVTLFLLNLFGF